MCNCKRDRIKLFSDTEARQDAAGNLFEQVPWLCCARAIFSHNRGKPPLPEIHLSFFLFFARMIIFLPRKATFFSSRSVRVAYRQQIDLDPDANLGYLADVARRDQVDFRVEMNTFPGARRSFEDDFRPDGSAIFGSSVLLLVLLYFSVERIFNLDELLKKKVRRGSRAGGRI